MVEKQIYKVTTDTTTFHLECKNINHALHVALKYIPNKAYNMREVLITVQKVVNYGDKTSPYNEWIYSIQYGWAIKAGDIGKSLD